MFKNTLFWSVATRLITNQCKCMSWNYSVFDRVSLFKPRTFFKGNCQSNASLQIVPICLCFVHVSQPPTHWSKLTRCLLLFNPAICFLWTFLHRRSHTCACATLQHRHISTWHVLFISLCSACGRKINRFKWNMKETLQLMSGIYGLCSHVTMWGIIHLICTLTNRDWEHDTLARLSFSVYLREIILSVKHHSFLAVSFPMAPSTQCPPHVYWILSCIWASNRASPTETHAKHFRSIRVNSVVNLWMQVEMPNLFSWVKLWVFIAKMLCKYVNCILLNTFLIMHLNQYLHFHKLSCSYSKLF